MVIGTIPVLWTCIKSWIVQVESHGFKVMRQAISLKNRLQSVILTTD